MNNLMRLMDESLGEYRWYRRYRGGLWIRILKEFRVPMRMWVRAKSYRKPNPDTVLEREDYRKRERE